MAKRKKRVGLFGTAAKLSDKFFDKLQENNTNRMLDSVDDQLPEEVKRVMDQKKKDEDYLNSLLGDIDDKYKK